MVPEPLLVEVVTEHWPSLRQAQALSQILVPASLQAEPQPP
jgi:hypothetical protein